MLKHFIILIAFVLFAAPLSAQQGVEKHRLIVLTDIENEPDDGESIVRLLLYSNVIDIEGIIATTSVHMKNIVAPESLLKAVEAYEKVLPNLLLHQEGWPKADYLRSIVTKGLPKYGMTAVGKGCDSEFGAVSTRWRRLCGKSKTTTSPLRHRNLYPNSASIPSPTKTIRAFGFAKISPIFFTS